MKTQVSGGVPALADRLSPMVSFAPGRTSLDREGVASEGEGSAWGAGYGSNDEASSAGEWVQFKPKAPMSRLRRESDPDQAGVVRHPSPHMAAVLRRPRPPHAHAPAPPPPYPHPHPPPHEVSSWALVGLGSRDDGGLWCILRCSTRDYRFSGVRRLCGGVVAAMASVGTCLDCAELAARVASWCTGPCVR